MSTRGFTFSFERGVQGVSLCRGLTRMARTEGTQVQVLLTAVTLLGSMQAGVPPPTGSFQGSSGLPVARGLPAPRPRWVRRGDGQPLGARVQGGGPAQVVCPQGPLCLRAQHGQLCELHSSQYGRDKSWDWGRQTQWAVWDLSTCRSAIGPSVWPLARFLGGHGALGLLRHPSETARVFRSDLLLGRAGAQGFQQRGCWGQAPPSPKPSWLSGAPAGGAVPPAPASSETHLLPLPGFPGLSPSQPPPPGPKPKRS